MAVIGFDTKVSTAAVSLKFRSRWACAKLQKSEEQKNVKAAGSRIADTGYIAVATLREVDYQTL
jgi:hypothetical protein